MIQHQVTFDLKHQLLSSLDWFKHRGSTSLEAQQALSTSSATAGAAAAGEPLGGVTLFPFIPQKALVADPVVDVRVAAWILETDNRKVSVFYFYFFCHKTFHCRAVSSAAATVRAHTIQTDTLTSNPSSSVFEAQVEQLFPDIESRPAL